jgi:hypothetical protein
VTHTITATNGAGSVEPVEIVGYTPSRDSRNIIHDLLDGSIGVSFQAPRPRSGKLKMLFLTEADAFEAFNLHAEETTFTYVNGIIISVSMTYVLDGSIDMDFDAQSGYWWVSVGFQETS